MRIIAIDDPEYAQIEEVLEVDPESTELEPLAGIDCDDDDIQQQRDDGDEDPIVTIELIAQWSEEGQQGILDWFFVRESGVSEEQPEVQLGGALLGFFYEGEEPDLEALLTPAVEALNQTVEWVEFELGDDED